jgi:hypothetical protein
MLGCNGISWDTTAVGLVRAQKQHAEKRSQQARLLGRQSTAFEQCWAAMHLLDRDIDGTCTLDRALQWRSQCPEDTL